MLKENIVLTANGLHKTYEMGEAKVMALCGVDLSIDEGEFIVLLGPSGAGKSTLLHVLSGLEAPDKGEVHVGAHSLYSLSDRKLSKLRSTTFGFMFQAYNLVSSLTVLENVEIPLRIAGIKEPARKAREMLAQVGLAERLSHRPGQLSGGEQQRVSIARALVCEPSIIFADEPTGNLDSTTGLEIVDMMTALVREKRVSCLMVTHNNSWAEKADRVLHLKDGQLRQ